VHNVSVIMCPTAIETEDLDFHPGTQLASTVFQVVLADSLDQRGDWFGGLC
jgi:hypothetical protein